jgi:ATP/maltotriose-dependent transcriptional regulator MalT
MSGQDALLVTKLHVPQPQPGFVPRPRLVQALSQGLARGRVLICAPAGFGKTSLLAEWARSGGRVALGTVKKHVTHVLGKLGAANRTEAVARARQLGLIP